MIPTASMRAMAGSLKEAMEARPNGKWESKLPWYTTAMGGLGGALAAQKLLPEKYQALGQLGGALLGTGIGLHGGEASGRKIDERKARAAAKTAEEGPSVVGTLGKSLLGLGVGAGAGYGAMELADHVMRRGGTGPGIPATGAARWIPAASAALGAASPILYQQTLQKLREAHLAKKGGGYDGKESRDGALRPLPRL